MLQFTRHPAWMRTKSAKIDITSRTSCNDPKRRARARGLSTHGLRLFSPGICPKNFHLRIMMNRGASSGHGQCWQVDQCKKFSIKVSLSLSTKTFPRPWWSYCRPTYSTLSSVWWLPSSMHHQLLLARLGLYTILGIAIKTLAVVASWNGQNRMRPCLLKMMVTAFWWHQKMSRQCWTTDGTM